MVKIVSLSIIDSWNDYEKSVFGKMDNVDFVISRARTPEEVKRDTRDAEVILFTDITINKEIIDNLEKCRLIIRYGIGYDNVDAAYAKEKGIIVCNAPNYGVVDVAEHAVSLIMSCAKRLTYMSDLIREGVWDTGKMGSSQRISGKTLGFLGFGKIARHVCKVTKALGMNIIAYDPYVSEEVLKEYGAKGASFDEVLSESDFVTLHLPLNPSTTHVIGEKELSKMKKTATLINTGRGGLVDEKALVEALENKTIAFAGLDVFENETGGIDKRMLSMQNVALTPHVAWNTAEASRAIHEEVVGNVLRYIRGEVPESIVNK